MSKNKRARERRKERMDRLRGIPIVSNGKELIPGAHDYEHMLKGLAGSLSSEELEGLLTHKPKARKKTLRLNSSKYKSPSR